MRLPLAVIARSIALAGLVAAAGAQAAAPLRICAARDNLPLSDDAPARGMEIEFGRVLAQRLGRPLELVWQRPGEGATSQALREKRCDAALGAVASGDALAPVQQVPGIALTRPYHSAGYVLVRRAHSPAVTRLDELRDERVAVEMVSIPIYTLKQRGHRVFAVDDSDAVIDAVADGRANYGYVWGPVAAWDLRDRADVVIDEGFEPEQRWDFALAVRADEPALRREIDRALAALDGSGELAALFDRPGP